MVSLCLDDLKQKLLCSIAYMDEADLLPLRQYLRLSSIRSTWSDIDMSLALPEDAITSVGSFLNAKDLSSWQTCNHEMFNSLDTNWYTLGMSSFENVKVDGRFFEERDVNCSSWFLRYTEFAKSLRLCVRKGVMSLSGPLEVSTCIPMYKKVSCTIPAKFSISPFGSRLFIQLTVSVKFSPDAVRSVIGLVDAPGVGGWGKSLECDRGLSRSQWGLAFGPLTGVVSCMGRYFDDFSTYRARHGLKDYLATAMSETVHVQVGIFIENGKVAFYRLPESDYSDWECTGFVYQVPDSQLYPAVMFSHIGHNDSICIKMNGIKHNPPFYPHTNTVALNWNGWNSFADEDQSVRPPPNSPRLDPFAAANELYY